MASFNHERVGHALDELLQRIVPDDPNDDEEAAEERLQTAYDWAMQQLIAAGEPKAVPDVDHMARLLESKSEPRRPGASAGRWLTVRQSPAPPETRPRAPACTTCSAASKTSPC